MKTLREPDTPALRQAKLADDLRQLEAHAARLHSLSHRAAMLAMATSVDLSLYVVRPGDIRRAMNAFGQTLGHLRQAGAAVLPRIPLAERAALSQALSPEAIDILDGFLVQMRTVCGQMDSDDPNLSLGRAELFRFINTELDAAIATLVKAVKEALSQSRADDLSLAFVDDLTGLPNRRALYRHAERAWAEAAKDQTMVLMRLDLDRFKKVNDEHGHAAGDHLLAHVARLMRAELSPADFVARVGGDEFVMILSTDPGRENLIARADRIVAAIGRPVDHEGIRLCVGVSIGVVQTQIRNCPGLDRLLHNADLALYAAKAAGGGRCHLFTSELRNRHESSANLLHQIEKGLRARQFLPYFQPQVDGRSGKLVGLEALARWHHPERGTLTPYHFLDAARQGGLLPELDEQITRATLAALRSWVDQGIVVPQVSINISAERLGRNDLDAALSRLVIGAGLPVESVALEILESAMIESSSIQMIETVRRLSAAGFRVELDDFGTGHASIANLRHFKVDRIKIDRSFIKDVHLHPELAKITAAMIGLAHSLRIDTLGEGVETPEERLVLNALGIDHIQGYGVARPMPAEEVGPWIARTQPSRILPPVKVRG